MKNKPKVIYLQTGKELPKNSEFKEESDFRELRKTRAVTWNDVRLEDSDLEYFSRDVLINILKDIYVMRAKAIAARDRSDDEYKHQYVINYHRAQAFKKAEELIKDKIMDVRVHKPNV